MGRYGLDDPSLLDDESCLSHPIYRELDKRLRSLGADIALLNDNVGNLSPTSVMSG